MRHLAALSLAVLLAVAALAPTSTPAQEQPASERDGGRPMTYHQVTSLGDPLGVGLPVLSGDGGTAAFAVSPASLDPELPNRVYVVDAEGGEPREVDAYSPGCYCASLVDISADGETVVSTEGLQLRIADGDGARQLLTAAEITALALAGDGETVFFHVRRDTAATDGTPLPRGIWRIDADGGDLRQVVSVPDLAELLGVSAEAMGCCFSGGRSVDVSADGSRLVFMAYAQPYYVFTADGEGGDLRVLAGPFADASRVAVSADGGTAAYEAAALESQTFEIGVLPTGGGEPLTITGQGYSFSEPIQLDAGGSHLLVAPAGVLFDTATGDALELAVAVAGSDSQVALIGGGLPRATMDDEGSRILYAMRTTRCADCANLPEELARLELRPGALEGAPAVEDVTLDPDAIGLEAASSTTITAAVSGDGEVTSVGYVALRDGHSDPNVASASPMNDDGPTVGDARAGDGVYTIAGVVHSLRAVREGDEAGPRRVRIQAELEAEDGRRHAAAVDGGTLRVGGSGETDDGEADDDGPPTTEAATEVVTEEATEVVATEETPEAGGGEGEGGGAAEEGEDGGTAEGGGDWSAWEGVPDPELCVVEPATAEEIVAAFTSGDGVPEMAVPDGVEDVAGLPPGEEPDAETAAGALDTARELIACANAGDSGRLFALFTPEGLRRVFVAAFGSLDPMSDEDAAEMEASLAEAFDPASVAPVAEADRSGVASIDDVRVLEDGRVLVVMTGSTVDDDGQIVVVLVEADGRWLIDEMHVLGEDIQLDAPMG